MNVASAARIASRSLAQRQQPTWAIVQIVDRGGRGSARAPISREARTGLDTDRNRPFVALPARQEPAAFRELSFQPQGPSPPR